MDRMLLASWVVSQFWAGFGQCIRLGKAVGKGQPVQQQLASEQRYFYFFK
jgi:hypothetical protein